MRVLASNLEAFGGISHGFFTRQGGVSGGVYTSLNCGLGSGDSQTHVHANRALAVEALGLEPGQLATLHQVHSPVARLVDAPLESIDALPGDGLVTTTPGLAVGVLGADCGPVLFAEPEAGVVAAAHAGNGGALAGIIAATVAKMIAVGAERRRIHAAIGPMISAASYEVGPEFVARFLRADAHNKTYFSASEREGHAMFDLPAFIMAQLRSERLASVVNLDICTYTDAERFFSYRRTTHAREDNYGRQLSAIALRAKA